MRILASIYGGLVAASNFLYSKNLRTIHIVSKPVVSVGNLTSGGTGKTPTIEWLIKWFTDEGVKVGVVAKGYGGKFSGIQKVSLPSKIFFGDEPEVLANKFPAIPVYVGKTKALTAQRLCAAEKIDLILVDDGFQHHGLHRDFDLLVVDPFAPESEWQLLPNGRLREPLTAASRANALVISRSNLLPQPQWPKSLLTIVEVFNQANKPVVESELHIEQLFCAHSATTKVKPADVQFLMSGIGKPKSFEALVKANGMRFLEHFVFRDHHDFSERDLELVLRKSNSGRILTTEKDYSKIKKLGVDLTRFAVCVTTNKWLGDVDRVKVLLKGIRS